MPEYKTRFTFKGKREHIAKVNIPKMAHPNRHIDIEMFRMLQDIMSFYQIPRKLRLILTLNQKTKQVVLLTT